MRRFLILLCLCLPLSSFATTLEDVLNYSLEHAPQFKQVEFLTKSQASSLRKVLAVYDSNISISLNRDKGTSATTGQSVVTNIGAVSVAKNIGLGTTLTASATSYGTDSDIYNSSVLLSASIDLLENILGKYDRNNVLGVTHSVDALNIALKNSREALVFGIIDLYLSALLIEKKLEEDKIILNNLIELEGATKKKLKLGASEKRHLLQVKASRLSTQIQIEALQEELKSSLHALQAVSGGKYFEDLTWPTPSNSRSKGESLSVAQLKLEKLKLEKDVDNAELKLLPTLKLTGSIGKESINNTGGHFKELDESSSSIGVSLSFPLGNTEASNEVSRVKYSLIEKELEIKREVLEFERDLAIYNERLKSLEKQLQLSDEVRSLQGDRYKQEFLAYKQGRSQINDIITAHNDLISSRLSFIATKRQFVGVNYAWLNLNGLLSSKLGIGK